MDYKKLSGVLALACALMLGVMIGQALKNPSQSGFLSNAQANSFMALDRGYVMVAHSDGAVSLYETNMNNTPPDVTKVKTFR